MAKFKCNNCGNETIEGVLTYGSKKDSNNETVPDESICKKCSTIMERVDKRESTGYGGFNISEINNPDKDFTRNRGGGSKPIY